MKTCACITSIDLPTVKVELALPVKVELVKMRTILALFLIC